MPSEIREGADAYRASGMSQIFLAALIGDAAAGLVAWLAIRFGVEPFLGYGIALFLILPAVTGIAVSAALEWREPRAFSDHVLADACAYAFACIGMFIFAAEGAVCLIMASFMAVPISFGASALARAAMSFRWRARPPQIMVSVLALAPLLVVMESKLPARPSVREVRTSLVIAAPPARVWERVLNLDSMSDPSNLLFRGGVAHPVSTRTESPTVGSRRVCELSTGTMPERVTAVERERLLRFEVLHTPPTMRELNPFGEVEAGHLNGFFECLEGEFVLEALPGGHTRVVGTTRYRHRFRPAAYWSVWTDYIVRCVHSRVLAEIARSCESQEASPAR